MRMKFYTKLIALISISLIITMLVGAIGAYFIKTSVDSNKNQYNNFMLPLLYIDDVIQNYRYANSLLLQMALDKDPEEIEISRQKLINALEQADFFMSKYMNAEVSDPYQKQLMDEVAQKLYKYDIANKEMIKQAENTVTDRLIEQFNAQNKQFRALLFDDAMEAINNLRSYVLLTVEQNNRENAAQSRRAQTIMLGIIIISIIVLLMAGMSLAKGVKKMLRLVIDFANAVSNKDFSATLPKELTDKDDEFGEMGKALAVMQTTLQESIQKMNESEKAAQSANIAKSNFLSHMSHEMRTPLNAVIGLTYIARQSNDKENIMNYLDKIDSTSNHLLGIINDVLDMSKIEAGRLELVEEEFSLEKTLINICNFISVRADEKKQNLIVNIDNNVSTRFLGDSQRLAQVITNLLGNAIKFSPQNGTIRLSVQLKERNSLYSTLLFSIEDNGIGITEEQRSRLFKPFEQADKSISKNFGGTGLGLAISSRIVQLMNGTIDVQSNYGKGSTFMFTVQLKNTAQLAKTTLSKNIDVNNTRILALDDSEDLLDFFNNLFNELGLEISTASTPAKALEILHEGQQEGRPYNILFVDWMMPDMDGISFIRKLRQHYEGQFVAILISIAKYNEIEKEAINAGVNRFLSKPIFPSTVINMLNEVFGSPRPEVRVMTKKEDADFSGRKLLLVEDVEINRDIVRAYLEPTGIIIEECVNGIEAINKYIEAQGQYDLILMDIQMPVMDGYTATKRIREEEAAQGWKAVPIIAMTANVFKEDIEKCLEAGMNDHIAKPINHDTTVSVMSKYINPCPAVSIDMQRTAQHRDDWINVEEALSRVLGKKELFAKMLSSFMSQSSVDLIVEYLNSHDVKKAAFEIHKQKGMAAAISATKLLETFESLEEDLQKDELTLSISDLREIMKATQEQAKSLVSEIKKELNL